jgi:hypothetical protein
MSDIVSLIASERAWANVTLMFVTFSLSVTFFVLLVKALRGRIGAHR